MDGGKSNSKKMVMVIMINFVVVVFMSVGGDGGLCILSICFNLYYCLVLKNEDFLRVLGFLGFRILVFIYSCMLFFLINLKLVFFFVFDVIYRFGLGVLKFFYRLGYRIFMMFVFMILECYCIVIEILN